MTTFLTIPRQVAEIGKLASKDVGRYVLNGIRIESRAEGWQATVTDGKLALAMRGESLADSFPCVPGFDTSLNGGTECILPADALKASAKLCAKHGPPALGHMAVCIPDASHKPVQIAATDLQTGSTQNVRPLDGAYPDMAQVFPEGEPKASVHVATGAGVEGSEIAALLCPVIPDDDAPEPWTPSK